MFDAPTAELIAAAPALDGLDLANLSKELTYAYSAIVSLRIRLSWAGRRGAAPPEEIRGIISRLERLGYAQEAFTAMAPERANRAAAAFVAATAHQLRFAAQVLWAPQEETTQISVSAIGPEIAATIMFLIADRVADAAQMSRSIRFEGSSTIEEQLRRAIAGLAQGNLGTLARDTGPWPEVIDGDLDAVSLLWQRLLEGLRILARDLLGLGDGPILEGTSSSIFAEVRGS